MASLFAPFPAAGPWTPLGLTRGQFLGILALSVGLFVVVGGPIWSHLRDRHFWRLGVSYAVILPAVAWALHRNHSMRPARVIVASGVLAVLKLVLTAGLMLLLALAAQ
jgi:hypothetical protein